MIKTCLVCGKEFITYPSKIKIGRGKYCSKKCCLKVTSIKIGQRLSPETEFKKGCKHSFHKYYSHCGRRNNYVMDYCPNHPMATKSGYVRRHRLVMEEKLGRYLTKEEEIHHKDGNGLNNNIENLQLISSKSEHLRLEHSLGTYSSK